jgi:Zn-finger nucleic acid-binding protein
MIDWLMENDECPLCRAKYLKRINSNKYQQQQYPVAANHGATNHSNRPNRADSTVHTYAHAHANAHAHADSHSV